ncbi:porphobilinogen synthase [Heliophilum fasciatum]|uniref:Delta-aminolevulinic acid dehydratase n=1 Tax=Heliophilum fasciatum TaxID=35700 RepID=A7UGV3_9FIRM|nr:porphobilinogen synthase [Heliophilum fasciatum]ABU41511.1 HemB [Heliophilum fasciatum]MCW2278471.1 porphobilinogen synthase [Heliophilum fasciatum]TCP63602.1 porphobilinogen synthase [Heliophilum fasciatum]
MKYIVPGFPIQRMRRLRENPTVREMVRENHLRPEDLIYPLFVVPGENVNNPVSSMPGVSQLSIDLLVKEAVDAVKAGVKAVEIFGIPPEKDGFGSGAYDPNGIVQEAVRAVRKACPDLYIITDVCLCQFTDHGHCGIVEGHRVLNDPTLAYLGRAAVSHAQAGADMVAPSDMMDGRVSAIRAALDEAGFNHIPIMSYSAKYASAFYGPFREAAESTPQWGDRRSYQMDPGNSNEALRETALDIQEGCDIIMVKPGLSYMDIIYRLKQDFGMPVAVYNVSGEYAMVKAAAANGWIDEKKTVLEILLSFKRSGADMIITYHAKDVVRWLAE